MIVISNSICEFQGIASVSGDKSISHRALIIASQAIGVSKIRGLSDGQDVQMTKDALRLLGIEICDFDDYVTVNGLGCGGLQKPKQALNFGNSGTSAALFLGLLSPYDFQAFFYGDDSLCSRSMGNVLYPLSIMGANFSSKCLPIVIFGSDLMVPIKYKIPVASAKIKSAILLASLNVIGRIKLIEPFRTRSHTEKMLLHSGANLSYEKDSNGISTIEMEGAPDLIARDFDVPKDPSSVAFFVAAAILSTKGNIEIKDVLVSSERFGFYKMIKLMGADVSVTNRRVINGEDVADIRAKTSELCGIEISNTFVSSMVDEYAIISIMASFATGRTVLRGLSVLKNKESNRLTAIVVGLNKCGVKANIVDGDSIEIFGKGINSVHGGATIDALKDHRIAMSFLVLGAFSKYPITVKGAETIATSFPFFIDIFNKLGGNISAISM